MRLDYKYFDGAWFVLPLFSKLIADESGTA